MARNGNHLNARRIWRPLSRPYACWFAFLCLCVTLGILWLAINNYLNSGYAFVGERNNANHGLTDDDERKIGEALSRSMKVENWKSRYRAIVWDDTTNLVVWGPEIGTLNVVENSQEGKPMVVRASVSCSKENYVWDAHIRKVGEKWVVTKQP